MMGWARSGVWKLHPDLVLWQVTGSWLPLAPLAHPRFMIPTSTNSIWQILKYQIPNHALLNTSQRLVQHMSVRLLRSYNIVKSISPINIRKISFLILRCHTIGCYVESPHRTSVRSKFCLYRSSALALGCLSHTLVP